MMNLSEYRRSLSHLVDFLPWAALVDEGIVLNKDGSFQRTARFRGPDLDSAVPAELVGVAGRLNNALRRLRLGRLCRGAASPRQPISGRIFPGCGLSPDRRRAPRAISGGRFALRIRVFPDLS